MESKRGISDVITTVLIILLVLAAIVIVWQAVKGTLTKGTETLEEQTQCLGVDLAISTIDAATDKVSITRNTGGDAAKVEPIILVKGAKTTANCTLATIAQLESTVCTTTTNIAAGDEITVGGKIGETTCPTTVKKTA